METAIGSEIVVGTRRNLFNYLKSGGNGHGQELLAKSKTRIKTLAKAPPASDLLPEVVQPEQTLTRRRLPLGD